jgi:hypothetical protein
MGNSNQTKDPNREPLNQKPGQTQGGDANRGREQQNQQGGAQRQQGDGTEHIRPDQRPDQNEKRRDEVQR